MHRAGLVLFSVKFFLADALGWPDLYYPPHTDCFCTRIIFRVCRRPNQVIRSCPFKSRGAFYVWLIRGTPLLVQLFLIFYALPSAGITLDAFPAAVIGFTLNIGAYTSEVIRATLLSVPKGQWEAAHSISMSWSQALRRIILPQAARVAVPPLSNTFISLVKDTSLASVITVPEMFLAAQRIAAVTYQPLILYTEAAVMYLMISSVLSALQTRLEVRLARNTVAKESEDDNAIGS